MCAVCGSTADLAGGDGKPICSGLPCSGRLRCSARYRGRVERAGLDSVRRQPVERRDFSPRAASLGWRCDSGCA
jgi:hypothetical protein